MNYFAHALHFLDDPYLAAGTGVPDWLTVADRRVRVRPESAQRLAADPQPHTASVAAGVLQHIRDDRRFHQSRAFAELSLELTAAARETLGTDTGFRPVFFGHLLVEVLLDASLLAEDHVRLEAYWRVLDSVDAGLVEQAVNRMASRPTNRLASLISGFCREQILQDYLEDGKLFVRLNQVMRRANLPQLPQSLLGLLPEARRLVENRKIELLEGIPTSEL